MSNGTPDASLSTTTNEPSAVSTPRPSPAPVVPSSFSNTSTTVASPSTIASVNHNAPTHNAPTHNAPTHNAPTLNVPQNASHTYGAASVASSLSMPVSSPINNHHATAGFPQAHHPSAGVPHYSPYSYTSGAHALSAQPSPSTMQYKRSSEDIYAPSTKRPKIDGPATPGSMGPPIASPMGPPGRKKDEGLDEGDPNDVFGGAGINLQDEERNMTAFEVPRTNMPYTSQPYQIQPRQDIGDRARRSDFLHYGAFEYMLKSRLSEYGLAKWDDEVYSLVSLAVKERLSGLLGQMLVLARHRCAPPPKGGKPIDDVGKILKSISLSEAQDEERRRTIAAARRAEEEVKRREAEDASSTSKKKASGPKTLSEQAIARNANATAQMMLNQSGGKKYSWMTGGANTSQLARRNTVQASNGILPNVFKSGSEELVSVMTLKDFIGAVELDGSDVIGKGGKALLKAYTQLKD